MGRQEIEPLGAREFRTLREIIFREVGIRLDDVKRALVETRIGRRVRDLDLPSFAAYVEYLAEDRGGLVERQAMINAITTNKTDFFREPHHFELLRDEVFPALLERIGLGPPRPIRIWSAGCSSGEEPYTLAMTVLDAGLDRSDVSIVATDVDTEVLARAKAGVYAEDRMSGLDSDHRNRFFLRGKGTDEGRWKVKPAVSSLVEFRQVNFIKPPWPVDGVFDIIFCRNVVIYFDRPTQVRLFDGFGERLRTDGFLFLGHSESLLGLSDRFTPHRGTVHRCVRGGAGAPAASHPARRAAPERLVASSPADEDDGDDVDAPPLETDRRPQSEAALPRKRIVVGEVFAAREPSLVSTVLGSCVAACLFDEAAGIGGMNHFLLPETRHDDGPLQTRYGVHAMERLINDLLGLGAKRRRLRAKVFGAAMIGAFRSEVQMRNATFIREFLKKEGIPLLVERLLGRQALDVRLRTDTGQVFFRPLAKANPTLAEQERAAMRSFEEKVEPEGGEIELF